MKKPLIILRRVSQIFFLLLFVYILWSTTHPLEGLLPPETFFWANPLIQVFTSISEQVALPGIAFAAVMIVLGLILGRFFCGWICPLGTMIDWVGALKKKKLSPNDKTNAVIRKIKYFILAAVAVFALFGVQVAWVMDPMVIVARFVSLNLIPAVTLGLNKTFIWLIQTFGLYGFVLDFYRTLKESVLGVEVHFFYNSGIILAVFLIVTLASLFVSRLWCRTLCPLGALYAFLAKAAPLRRVVRKCINCGACKSDCRMGAIKDDISYVKSECILCMDCLYDCPVNGTVFKFKEGEGHHFVSDVDRPPGSSRRNFLFFMLTPALANVFKGKLFGNKNKKRNVIRPPGALTEHEFKDRCVRCGNCMKVCPTNVIHPATFESGVEGIWTPRLVYEIGYCEFNCTLCGQVCPTDAIPNLSMAEKHLAKMGTAQVDRSICIAWAEGKECIVCEEHCPVHDKAIKLEETIVNGRPFYRPVVDPTLCIGCGICQNKCPVRPKRAIRVRPE